MKPAAKPTASDPMLCAPISKQLLSLALPAMGSMLITSAVSLVDSLAVSRLGAAATGAVGICFALQALIQAIGFTLGMGGGSLISLQLGSKHPAQASRTARISFGLSLFCGLFIAAGIFWRQPILRLLGASDTILPLAQIYSFCLFLAAPFMTGGFCLSHLLRGEGKTQTVLTAMLLSGILNILLDLLLTKPLGIAGVSLAALISQAVTFLLLLSTFLTGKTTLQFTTASRPRHSAPPAASFCATALRIIGSGSPSLLRQGLVVISSALLSRSARLYGDEAVAALSVAGKIFMIPFTLMLGYGQGLQPLIGFNYAAGNAQRIRRASHFTLWAGTLVLTAAGGLICWQAEALIRLFLDDAEGIAMAVTTLRASALTLPLIPACTLANLGYQAIHRPWTASFLAAARQGLFFVPLILWLPRAWGLAGVQLSQALADGATFVLSVPFLIYFFRKAVDKNGLKV